ncbi:MAG: hypothetical protein HYS24_04675 [Ignavibacteriales bacterium]|jgi:hypothetical protein|nr:hypothetical protein [Ignavibacteriales bacterium]MBK7980564.1 hypothetical protein [Ignavibacteriota bacterium]
MINQIIELAKRNRIIKQENMILENSFKAQNKEDKTIKIIAKEFSDFILRLYNNLEKR